MGELDPKVVAGHIAEHLQGQSVMCPEHSGHEARIVMLEEQGGRVVTLLEETHGLQVEQKVMIANQTERQENLEANHKWWIGTILVLVGVGLTAAALFL